MPYIRYTKSSEYNASGEFPLLVQYDFKYLIEWWQDQLKDRPAMKKTVLRMF